MSGPMRVSRLRALFDVPGKKLIVAFDYGEPSPGVTVDAAVAAAAAGADVIQLDADGGLDSALVAVGAVRVRGCFAPIILGIRHDVLREHGFERACRDAVAAGVDAILLADFSTHEAADVELPARDARLDVLPVVKAGETPDLIARAAALRPPFVVYAVAAPGSVGDLAARVAEARTDIGAPVAAGGGIATVADARSVAACADAIVVDSEVARVMRGAPGAEVEAVRRLVATLKAAIS